MKEHKETIKVAPLDCSTCAMGPRPDSAQFCPFIVRNYGAGDLLYRVGDEADYVWLIKDGVVGLSPGDEGGVDELALPGAVIGSESQAGSSYAATARALCPVVTCGATRLGFEQWKEGKK